MHFSFLATLANTGPATFNVNGLGAKAIKKRVAGVAVDIGTNDIGPGAVVEVVYDGSVMQAQNLVGSNLVVLNVAQNFTSLQTFGGGLSLGAAPQSISLQNASPTGTTTGLLVSLTGAPATATKAALSATTVVGVCVANCGTTGSAEVAIAGLAACTFENATVAGHLVIPGTGTQGQCRDSGQTVETAIPLATQIVGVVLETGSAVSHLMEVYGGRKTGTQISLTSAVSGILPVANGGSGAATFTAGLLLASGASPFTTVAAPSSAVVGKDDVQTLTQKWIQARVLPLSNLATIPIAVGVGGADIATLSALSQTSQFANPTGSPVDGQRLIIRVTSALPQNVSFQSQFNDSPTAPRPTTTTGGNKTDYWGYIFRAPATKWDYMPLVLGFP